MMKAWTQAHLKWVKSAVHFDHAAQEATLLDYLHEVDHVVGNHRAAASDQDLVRLLAERPDWARNPIAATVTGDPLAVSSHPIPPGPEGSKGK